MCSVTRTRVSAMSSSTRRFLAVFDFDHTVVDDNTDTAVQDIGGHGIPDDVRAVAKADGWTAFMGRVFGHLHSKGVKKDEYQARLDQIPFTHGMKDLLKGLSERCGDVIIISDSNSFFIAHILAQHELDEIFEQVFTNPADFEPSGLLKIEPHHHNETCTLSGVNLCKGRVLTEYLERRRTQGVEYSFVCYVGDGGNDFCPMLTLGENDLACTRAGAKYAIDSVIAKRAAEGLALKAERVNWTSGTEILQAVRTKLGES